MPDPSSAEVTVSVTQHLIDTFDAAVGHGPGAPPAPGSASHMLAMTWLSQPAIRTLVLQACPPGTLPVQTSQFVAMPHQLPVEDSILVSATVARRGEEIVLAYQGTDQSGIVRTHGEIGFICVAHADLERVLA